MNLSSPDSASWKWSFKSFPMLQEKLPATLSGYSLVVKIRELLSERIAIQASQHLPSLPTSLPNTRYHFASHFDPVGERNKVPEVNTVLTFDTIGGLEIALDFSTDSQRSSVERQPGTTSQHCNGTANPT